MNLNDYLQASLSTEDIVQIMYDYDELTKTGVTGDTKLREVTEKYAEEHHQDAVSTVIWMDQVAHWCARCLAWRYIDTLSR